VHGPLALRRCAARARVSRVPACRDPAVRLRGCDITVTSTRANTDTLPRPAVRRTHRSAHGHAATCMVRTLVHTAMLSHMLALSVMSPPASAIGMSVTACATVRTQARSGLLDAPTESAASSPRLTAQLSPSSAIARYALVKSSQVKSSQVTAPPPPLHGTRRMRWGPAARPRSSAHAPRRVLAQPAPPSCLSACMGWRAPAV